MKKVLKVLGILALVLVLGVGIFAYRYRQELSLLWRAKTVSAEERQAKREELHKEQQDYYDKQEITVPLPSLEDMDDLLEGRRSAGEVKESLGLMPEEILLPDEEEENAPAAPAKEPASVPASAPVTPAPAATPPAPVVEPAPAEEPPAPVEEPPAPVEEPTPAVPEKTPAEQAKAVTERYVSALTNYELDLMEQLGEMKKQATAEYTALPKAERTHDKLVEIGFAWLDRVYEVEVEADYKVQKLLKGLRAELTALNADTAVADEIWRYYCTEKDNAKAYYMDKYL